MPLKKGYFSLCQYTWPLARREPLTVGVLLICPDEGFKEARFLDAFSHLRWRLGDTFEDEHVESLVQTVRAWIDREPVTTSVAGWDALAGRLGNELEMTPMRAVRFQDPSEGLNRLFEEMVKPPVMTCFSPRLVTFRVRARTREDEQSTLAQAVRLAWPRAEQEENGNELRFHKGARHLRTVCSGGYPPDPTALLQFMRTGEQQWACAVWSSTDSKVRRILDALQNLGAPHPELPSSQRWLPTQRRSEAHA